MKKLLLGIALASAATTHTVATAAQPALSLDRAGSNVSEDEKLSGSGTIAALLAIAAGIGIIVAVEASEDDDDQPDDQPVSP